MTEHVPGERRKLSQIPCGQGADQKQNARAGAPAGPSRCLTRCRSTLLPWVSSDGGTEPVRASAREDEGVSPANAAPMSASWLCVRMVVHVMCVKRPVEAVQDAHGTMPEWLVFHLIE
jgi:hypothetical protein